jgi:hypothetical protein
VDKFTWNIKKKVDFFSCFLLVSLVGNRSVFELSKIPSLKVEYTRRYNL